MVIDPLGGYRLLRRIGVGSRAEVFLAHPVRSDAVPTPAVIKVYGPAVSDESILAEAEALSRAAGDHVVRVLDATATADGAPALILSRHAAGSLARILGERASLAAGEVVTVLAPLAATLARLHAAGVSHCGIGPGAVLFDAAGSPTLACFGKANLFAPGLSAAGLEAEQSVLVDVLAFGALAATMLDRAVPERAGREAVMLETADATVLAHRARTEAAPGAWLAGFAEALFDLAEPLPVDLRSGADIDHVPFPSRVIAAQAVAPAPEPPTVPAWRVLAARVREALGRVRRPLWLGAGGAILGLVIAVMIVPQGQTAATTPPSLSPVAPTIAPRDEGSITADDPAAALIVLLEVRERCIRELSVECLDDVDQRDTAAFDSDRELIRSILAGAEFGPLPELDPASVELTQRLGDSALLSLGPDSEPASVLLVKGEAGWRIRDYLAE